MFEIGLAGIIIIFGLGEIIKFLGNRSVVKTLDKIQEELEIYKEKNDSYPVDLGDFQIYQKYKKSGFKIEYQKIGMGYKLAIVLPSFGQNPEKRIEREVL